MSDSILDDLGQEVTGIVAPVSICMFLTVVLVRLLNPEGNSNPSAVAIAQTYYKEQAGDTAGTKFEGALINALIFVVIVGAMTFVLFLLFKYGCVKCIYGYMGFAGFSIFFMLTGIVAIQLLQMQPIPVDWISFVFILWNFSAVGTITLFTWPAPLLMKQGYLVATGVIVAYVFTGIPEWTTWILLVAMALYDIAAVLTPSGPLKLLVELAMERDADIPALVYEARPTGRGGSRHQRQRASTSTSQEQDDAGPVPRSRGTDDLELTDQSSRSSQSQDTTPTQHDSETDHEKQRDSSTGESHSTISQIVGATGGVGLVEAAQGGPVSQGPAGSEVRAGTGHVAVSDAAVEGSHAEEDEESAPLIGNGEHAGSTRGGTIQRGQQGNTAGEPRSLANDEELYGLPDAIKLGMGDFIFYSILVGRAAMYDLLTVFASYLAIIAGLGATLILLALFRKALPALPISIALGVSFYFLARGILEPFALPLSVHLLYF